MKTRPALAAVVVTSAVDPVLLGAVVSGFPMLLRDQVYPAARVDAAFNVVADMLLATRVVTPMAIKGDLAVPRGCSVLSADAQSECMDIAYEPPTDPSIVVETTEGSTTTLMRVDTLTAAEFRNERKL